FLVPIVVALGLFIMIGWVAWVESRRKQVQAKMAGEVHAKLLEKFATSDELVNFLRTDEGRRFMANAAGPGLNPLERILRSIKIGVVLVAIGVGWLLLGLTNRFDDEGALTLIGFVFESAGAGFLVAAGVSYYFSKKWKLFD